MSVLVLSTQVYNKVATTLCTINARNEQSLENPLGVRSLFSHYEISSPQDICRFIARLEAYNYDTCDARRNPLMESPDTESLELTTQQFVSSYESFHAKRVGIFQLYKWICCINYNIDLDGFGARYKDDKAHELYQNDIKLAMDLEHRIASHIVASLPEYDAAKWSDL